MTAFATQAAWASTSLRFRCVYRYALPLSAERESRVLWPFAAGAPRSRRVSRAASRRAAARWTPAAGRPTRLARFAGRARAPTRPSLRLRRWWDGGWRPAASRSTWSSGAASAGRTTRGSRGRRCATCAATPTTRREQRRASHSFTGTLAGGCPAQRWGVVLLPKVERWKSPTAQLHIVSKSVRKA
eukprot:6214540-Pleurochrysis_carterae.AAC.9